MGHSRRRNTTTSRDDEYAGIANEIRFQSGILRNKYTLSLKKYHNSFQGQELMKYLMERKVKSKEESVQVSSTPSGANWTSSRPPGV